MIERVRRARCITLEMTARIILCLLLMTAIDLAAHKWVYAQGIAPGWAGPLDISYPMTVGEDRAGAMFCDAYQNLHIFWGKGREGGSEIYYRTDKDGSLSASIDVLATPYDLTVGLSVAVTESDNILHLTWANAYVQGSVYYSRVSLAEAANPRAWDVPRLLVDPADSVGIYADKSGTLHLIYALFEDDGYRAAIYQMRSFDSGLTWSNPSPIYEIATDVPSYLLASPAIDEAGRIHIGITHRSQKYGLHFEVGYIRSPDSGRTWEPYQVIAKKNEAMPLISDIAPFTFGSDEVHLTWHNPRRMHMWSNDGGVTWNEPVEIIRLDAGFGGLNYLAKDSAGVLRAATSVNSGIFVSTFEGAQWLAHERIENRDMDPHGQRMIICQGNQLHVTYDNRLEVDSTVWYAHKEVDAPYIEPSPIPTPVATVPADSVTPEALSTLQTPGPATSAILIPSALNVEPPPPTRSVLTLLLVPTALVIVLICFALVARKMRQW